MCSTSPLNRSPFMHIYGRQEAPVVARHSQQYPTGLGTWKNFPPAHTLKIFYDLLPPSRMAQETISTGT